MEFNNQYLSYEEYKSLGGTLGEMPFNILEFKCRKIIDNLTFNRLTNLETQIQEVKMCIYDMINISSKYEQTSNKQAQGIASENIDGYSVSYGSINAEQVLQGKMVLNHWQNILCSRINLLHPNLKVKNI